MTIIEQFLIWAVRPLLFTAVNHLITKFTDSFLGSYSQFFRHRPINPLYLIFNADNHYRILNSIKGFFPFLLCSNYLLLGFLVFSYVQGYTAQIFCTTRPLNWKFVHQPISFFTFSLSYLNTFKKLLSGKDLLIIPVKFPGDLRWEQLHICFAVPVIMTYAENLFHCTIAKYMTPFIVFDKSHTRKIIHKSAEALLCFTKPILNFLSLADIPCNTFYPCDFSILVILKL